MQSFLSGFRGAQLLVLAAALVLCGISWAWNAVLYTSTQAEVLRVEEQCVIGGEPPETATGCAEARASGRKPLRRFRAVHVRYTSPADGQVHRGVLYPLGRKAKEAAMLRPGDQWEILAHDSNAGEIKVE